MDPLLFWLDQSTWWHFTNHLPGFVCVFDLPVRAVLLLHLYLYMSLSYIALYWMFYVDIDRVVILYGSNNNTGDNAHERSLRLQHKQDTATITALEYISFSIPARWIDPIYSLVLFFFVFFIRPSRHQDPRKQENKNKRESCHHRDDVHVSRVVCIWYLGKRTQNNNKLILILS